MSTEKQKSGLWIYLQLKMVKKTLLYEDDQCNVASH